MTKIVVALILFVNISFAQGLYLFNENSISIGASYSKYSSDSRLAFGASYTYKGLFDLSYSRFIILPDDNFDNYQNEYFFRAYILKENIFFFSAGVGYITSYSKTELWKNFPLEMKSNDFTFELGMHLTSKIDENRNFVISVFYRHFKPTLKYKVPNIGFEETVLTRSLIADFGFIFNFNQLLVEIGPRINIGIDRGEPVYGLNLNLMLKH